MANTAAQSRQPRLQERERTVLEEVMRALSERQQASGLPIQNDTSLHDEAIFQLQRGNVWIVDWQMVKRNDCGRIVLGSPGSKIIRSSGYRMSPHETAIVAPIITEYDC